MLAALLRHGALRSCWARGGCSLLGRQSADRPPGPLPAALLGLRPLSGTGWLDRQYPFKPPLRRVRQGGKWMQRQPPPAAAAGRAGEGRPWARPGRGAPRQRCSYEQPRLVLPRDGSAVLLGSRLPRPDLARLGRARAARAAAAAEAGPRPNVTRQDVWEEEALSHNTGMQLLFLGTGTGHPAELRRAGSLALKTLRSIWLFDCGEDTQRQMHRQPLIRHGKVERIFLTNTRLANILGLPGMLCTMSAARAVGLDVADVPLHLYGPPGLADFIRPLLQLSDTYIAMPVVVHELVEHAVPPEGQQPQCLDRRSCLFRVRVPPDALNPEGSHDGSITRLLDRARARTRVLAKGLDERANVRELPLPPPGDPGARVPDAPGSLRWTIRCERDQMVTAVRVPAAVPSWAFVCQEADRVGRLDVERCRELEVPPGRPFSALKEGRSVHSATGRLVHPHEVVGPDIPGRKLVVVGESNDSRTLAQAARGADAVVHAACCEVTAPDGTSSARHAVAEACAFAAQADARHLVLYRFAPGQRAGQEAAPQGTRDGGSSPARGAGEARGAAAGCLDQLNPLNAYEWERRAAPGGHLCHAKGHWEPAEGPAAAAAAARAHAEALLGRPRAVSLADDMALFAVERRLPLDGAAGGARPRQAPPGGDARARSRPRAAVA